MKGAILISMVIFLCACKGPAGHDGSNGTNGVSGTVVNAQPFCPAIPGAIGYANRESYLIIGTDVYAVYADGTHTFLTLLNNGNYTTTDGRACSFTVNNGQVL